MAAECQGLCGEKEGVSEERVRFSLGARVAGTGNILEAGIHRQTEPSLIPAKALLPWPLGLVCTTSQGRGWNLSKTRQIPNFFRVTLSAQELEHSSGQE